MSNAVYPSLPGLMFGVQRIVIPPPVSLRTTPSRREYRARDSTLPRYKYKLNYEFLRSSEAWGELQTLVGFFNARGGSFDSFLFVDPDDSSATQQVFGVGDGSSTAFQLTRAFGGFVEPVHDLSDVPLVYVDGQAANLMMNSGFELRTVNQPYGFEEYNNAYISTTYTAAAGFEGGFAFGLKANASTSETFGVRGGSEYNPGGGVTGGVRAGGWQPNKSFSISFYARKIGGAGWTGMVLRWNVGPAASTTVSNPNLSSSWQRYEFRVTMGSDVEPHGRLYISVVGNTVANDEIHIDALHVMMDSGSASYVGGQSYTVVDSTAGVISFDVAPPAAASLSWSGSFYRRVRFALDQLEATKFLRDLWEAKRVDLLSVLAEP